MVQTRRGGENPGEAPGASNAGGNQPPPNAPPMTPMEQLIHNQNEMFRMFMENMSRQGAHGPPPQQPRESSYADFWATHPPTFGEAGDPLEADNFIRTLESKFALLHCTEQQKPLFAAQQLRGSASAFLLFRSLPAGAGCSAPARDIPPRPARYRPRHGRPPPPQGHPGR